MPGRVVSLSRLCPVRAVSLSGLFPCPGFVCPGSVLSRLGPVRVVSCPGYVPVWVVSIQVVSVQVASYPGCVCLSCVLAPLLHNSFVQLEHKLNSRTGLNHHHHPLRPTQPHPS